MPEGCLGVGAFGGIRCLESTTFNCYILVQVTNLFIILVRNLQQILSPQMYNARRFNVDLSAFPTLVGCCCNWASQLTCNRQFLQVLSSDFSLTAQTLMQLLYTLYQLQWVHHSSQSSFWERCPSSFQEATCVADAAKIIFQWNFVCAKYWQGGGGTSSRARRVTPIGPASE